MKAPVYLPLLAGLLALGTEYGRGQEVEPGDGDCDLGAFEAAAPSVIEMLYDKCDPTGVSCFSECRSILIDWSAKEPCLREEDPMVLLDILVTFTPENPELILLLLKACDSPVENDKGPETDDICDLDAFLLNSRRHLGPVYQSCDLSGESCYPACQAVFSEWFAREPCLRQDAEEVLRKHPPDPADPNRLLLALESCDRVPDPLPEAEGDGSEDCDDFMALADISQPYMEQFYKECDYTGESCWPECRSVFSEWFARDPCMRPQAMNVAKEVGRRHYPFLPEPNWLLLAMETCDRWDMESRDSPGGDSPDGTMDDGCDMEAFGVNGQPFWQEAYRKCDWSGKKCYSACATLFSKWRSQEPCLGGDALGEVKSAIRRLSPDTAEQSITLLESCDGVSDSLDEADGDEGEHCDFMALAQSSQPYLEQLYQKCDSTGPACNPECESLLSRWSAKEPCLRGDALARTKSAFRAYTPRSAELNIRILESCDNVSVEIPVINRGVCDYEAFGEKSPPYFTQLHTKCDTTGTPCSSDCQSLLSDWAVRETCLRGDAWRMTKSVFRTFSPTTAEVDIKLLESCNSQEVRAAENAPVRGVSSMLSSSSRVVPSLIVLGLVALGAVIHRAIPV